MSHACIWTLRRWSARTATLPQALCQVDAFSHFKLLYNWTLICDGEVWRLVTTFFYFGALDLNFLFHMYFLVRALVNDNDCCHSMCERRLGGTQIETRRYIRTSIFRRNVRYLVFEAERGQYFIIVSLTRYLRLDVHLL